MNHNGTGGLRYATSRKLNVSEQFTVARKLGPATPILQGIVSADNEGKDPTLLVLFALGQLSDEASEIVKRTCLSVVTAEDMTGKPVPLQAANGTIMFQEVTLEDLLHLTAKVIQENLGDFFRTALSGLSAQAAAQPT